MKPADIERDHTQGSKLLSATLTEPTDRAAELRELWRNHYLSMVIFEAPCFRCGGDLVIQRETGVQLAKFCNDDVSEMLPTITEFVERKRLEDARAADAPLWAEPSKQDADNIIDQSGHGNDAKRVSDPARIANPAEERERDLARIDEILAELPRRAEMNDIAGILRLDEELGELKDKWPDEG